MDVRFLPQGVERAVASILSFQKDGESAFWTEPLFHFYPQLDRARVEKMPHRERTAYLADAIRSIYSGEKDTLAQKAEQYAAHWAANRAVIEAAFSDAFETDVSRRCNDLVCEVSLNPIEPRFLRERRFEVFYRNSERGALGEALHELTHFLWFEAWERIFQEGYEAYERPSLTWILSEMVVEPILSDERLVARNPYYRRENGGCVYPYFYDMRIGGALVLERLGALYRKNGLEAFMRAAHRFCLENEREIRAHIERAECRQMGEGSR